MARRTSTSGINWEAIEKDYRLGDLSMLALCKKHCISMLTLRRHMTELGIVRDYTPQVQAATRAIISGDDIEGAGQRVAAVINRHISWAEKAGAFAANLLADLVAVRAGEVRPGLMHPRESITDAGVKVMNMLERAIKLERMSHNLDSSPIPADPIDQMNEAQLLALLDTLKNAGSNE